MKYISVDAFLCDFLYSKFSLANTCGFARGRGDAHDFFGGGVGFPTDVSYSKFSLMCVLLHLSVTNLPFDEGHRITCVYIHMNIYFYNFGSLLA